MEAGVDMRKRMRNVKVASFMIVLSFVFIALFWYREYQHNFSAPSSLKEVRKTDKTNKGKRLSFQVEQPVYRKSPIVK
ncbi:hypothetical protein KHS38_05625 [Mucilaginibacter sp. Bleaf8]|uniref:hypothetical protein n=1 Tax=Mucilaginibacter sp. Bleaf8 TaxID=2834430 RepID=UPI001BCBB466|nr:hypothetical protein [Mucilaginibacter sp. Bleaf8]MBS7563877.1 hypothetical protein [Mucilaginibacter sp. Bleaf8]